MSLLMALGSFMYFVSLSIVSAQLFSETAVFQEIAVSVSKGDYSERPHYILSSLSRLIEDVKKVEDKPCPVALTRTILVPDENNRVGLETALGCDVELEEDGDSAALITRPVSPGSKYDRWAAYISGTDGTAGGRAFQNSLTLRRYARIVKLESFCQSEAGLSLYSLNETVFEHIKDSKMFQWLVNDIFEPVTLVLEPQLRVKMGRDLISTGPASFRHTVLNITSDISNPSAVAMDAGRAVVSRTDSCIFVGDIDGIVSVDEAIDQDSLGDILGHECFHGIMFDMMGAKTPGKKFSLSKSGHDAHVVSDFSLALSEGWAELYEAWSGKDNPAFDKTEDMTRFIVGRQSAVRNNKYIQSGYHKYNNTKSTGLIKNGSQLISNEGFVAAILYRIIKHDDIEDGFGLAVRAMYLKSPSNLCELITAMAELAPDKRTSDIILKVFLFGSKFATVSSEARSLYQDYYQARLSYLHGKNSKLSAKEIEELQVSFNSANNAYIGFVKSLLPSLLSGELAIDSAVGPELWMDLKSERLLAMRININTATLVDFVTIGLTEEGALEVLSIRNSLGAITSIEDLRTVNNVDLTLVKLLLETHRN
jgi:hypothetical protein